MKGQQPRCGEFTADYADLADWLEEMATVASKRIRLKDGAEVVLRSSEESDAPAFLEVRRALVLDGEGMIAEPDEFNKTEDEIRTWIATHVENPRNLLLVAEVHGRLVGSIDFEIARRRRLAHSGHFAISVHPDWRNRGIGNALLESLLTWAQTLPEIEKINLKVRADNPRAIALYRKHGFVQSGCERNAIKLADGVYVDDLSMERLLV